jgi:hypothetical protein
MSEWSKQKAEQIRAAQERKQIKDRKSLLDAQTP